MMTSLSCACVCVQMTVIGGRSDWDCSSEKSNPNRENTAGYYNRLQDVISSEDNTAGDHNNNTEHLFLPHAIYIFLNCIMLCKG